MPIEVSLLGWAGVLLLVHIIAAAFPKTLFYGFSYAAGTQDEQKPPPNQYAERAGRASRNMLETFPVFAAAVLGLAVTGKTGGVAEVGAWMYLAGRIAYWPVYVFGVPLIRSGIWMLSLAGIIIILVRLLEG
jgi:uncharacterized MAPEG superfamily protein